MRRVLAEFVDGAPTGSCLSYPYAISQIAAGAPIEPEDRLRSCRERLVHPNGSRSGRNVFKQRAEPLRHGRVRQNGVAEYLIREFCKDRGLHRSHDLAGLGTNHRKAENAIISSTDNGLHESLRFVRRFELERLDMGERPGRLETGNG